MTTLINLDELYKKKIDILVERDAIWKESHPCSKNVINAIKYDDGKKHPQDAYIRNINKIIVDNLLNIEIKETVVYSERHFKDELKKAENNCEYILLLQPFPKEWSFNEGDIANMVLAPYDIEGIHPLHVTKFYNGKVNDNVYPCTAKAVTDIIEYVTGKSEGNGEFATIVGRSPIVGKPLIHMLLNKNYSVNICHSYTDKEDIRYCFGQSNIIITCLDKPEIFDDFSFFNKNTLIIDVGTCISEKDGKLVGNISREFYNLDIFDDIKITPVPKGVGRITPLILLENFYNLKFFYSY